MIFDNIIQGRVKTLHGWIEKFIGGLKLISASKNRNQ